MGEKEKEWMVSDRFLESGNSLVIVSAALFPLLFLFLSLSLSTALFLISVLLLPRRLASPAVAKS